MHTPVERIIVINLENWILREFEAGI